MEAQRGFTLVEVVAAVAILALLTGAVVAMSLAQRPGSLRAATAGFDASLAAARALAATSGNGATLAFAPRRDAHGNALPGFTLSVYRGRPNAEGAVTPSNVAPLVSDADVRERTLGSPPFAIFLSSSGDPSGEAAYPQFDARGGATFATIAAQPPCPVGGFALTFSDVRATQVRSLPCAVSAVGTPMPLVTMTPSPVVLTPSALVYDWPGAPRQSFVATEWGYTRWYSAQSFTCSAASFPQSDPAPPYSAPHSPDDVTALPTPPSGVPISYANAPDSMQDAPARFYVDPAASGTCSQAISDANHRYSRVSVQVMGQLTATPATLTWTSAADRAQRSSMFGKTYDATGLDLSVVSNTCAGVATFSWGGRSYPTIPGPTASQERLYLTPVAGPDGANVGGSCAISVASQYPGEPPATVTINVPSEMRTWPIAVKYAVNGGQLAYASHAPHDFGAILNRVLGGGTAFASGCTAIAYKDATFTNVDSNNTTFASLGLTTDANGCYNGALVAYEPSGQSATFSVTNNICGLSLAIGAWAPSATGPAAALSANGGSTPTVGCAVMVSDGMNVSPTSGAGVVMARVVSTDADCGAQFNALQVYFGATGEGGAMGNPFPSGFFVAPPTVQIGNSPPVTLVWGNVSTQSAPCGMGRCDYTQGTFDTQSGATRCNGHGFVYQYDEDKGSGSGNWLEGDMSNPPETIQH